MAQSLHDEHSPESPSDGRAQIAVEVAPELYAQIAAAAQTAHLSLAEYVERTLRQSVAPAPGQQASTKAHILELLQRTRKSVSGGRTIPDSTEIVRQMRDEHTTGGPAAASAERPVMI